MLLDSVNQFKYPFRSVILKNVLYMLEASETEMSSEVHYYHHIVWLCGVVVTRWSQSTKLLYAWPS